jgi:hypothetical protein
MNLNEYQETSRLYGVIDFVGATSRPQFNLKHIVKHDLTAYRCVIFKHAPHSGDDVKVSDPARKKRIDAFLVGRVEHCWVGCGGLYGFTRQVDCWEHRAVQRQKLPGV